MDFFSETAADTGRHLLSSLSGNAAFLHGLKRNYNTPSTLFLASIQAYVTSLVGIGGSLIVLACVSLIYGILLCLSPYCFRKIFKEETGKCLLVFTRIILLLSSIVIAILAIIAIYENSKFTPIFDTFTNTVTTGTQYESQFAASIENRLLTINATETNYIRNLYLFNVSLIQQGDHIANQGTTKSNELNSNKIYALIFFGFTIAFTFLTVLCGILTGIFPKKVMSVSTGVLTVIALILIFLCLALYLPIGVISADFCYDITDYTIHQRLLDRQNSNYTMTYGGINDIMGCINLYVYNVFVAIREGVQQSVQAQLNSTTPGTPQYAALQQDLANLTDIQTDLDTLLFCDYLDTYISPNGPDTCGIYVNSDMTIFGVMIVAAFFEVILGISAFGASVIFNVDPI